MATESEGRKRVVLKAASRLAVALVSVGALMPCDHTAQAAPLVVSNADVDLDLSSPPVDTDGVDVGGGADFGGTLSAINGTITPSANWTNIGDFNVGVLDFITPSGPSLTTGSVELTTGSYLVNAGPAVIGRGFNKRGTMNINAGAVWVNSGQVLVGAGGGGGTHELNIYGSVTFTQNASIGVGDGTTAVANVQGVDAIWLVNDNSLGTLDIGSSGGTGTMNILDGGVVYSTWGFVGTGTGFFPNSPSDGQVVITGSDALNDDSYWNVDSYLSVGEFGGTGSLTVNDRGHANINSRLYVGMGGGQGTVAVNTGGRVHVLNVIEIWDGSTIDLSGGGRMLAGSGFIESAISDGGLLIGFGGALLGDGTINADVKVVGGSIKPGHSPGKLTINGDLILDADSVLDIELGGTGAGQYDQIEVLGSTLLAGTLNLNFLSGFNVSAGDSFALNIFLNDANLNGELTSFSVEGLGPNLELDLDLTQIASGQPLDVMVVAVPEPSCAAAVLLLTMAGATRRPRRR
ncbi:MAG: hypothetical protein IT445_14460 [Phycisphaeraceae bacterium]|nr:hypothetical protein [Phycisphaeraceae bacterium]